MVVAISAERYRAICFPLSLRQNPAKYIAFVLLLSFTHELPRWFEFRHRLVVSLLNGFLHQSFTFYYSGSCSYFNVTHYATYTTTDMMEDPAYISFSSWDEIYIKQIC